MEDVLHEGETSLVRGIWWARCQSGQSVADCKSGCGCSVLAGSLIEDMGEVIGHGFLTQCQYTCDLTIALALDDELEHLSLTLGQMRRKQWACWAPLLRGKSTQLMKDLVCGMGHPEFLKQGKRLIQQILDTPGTSSTTPCEFNMGSS